MGPKPVTTSPNHAAATPKQAMRPTACSRSRVKAGPYAGSTEKGFSLPLSDFKAETRKIWRLEMRAARTGRAAAVLGKPRVAEEAPSTEEGAIMVADCMMDDDGRYNAPN